LGEIASNTALRAVLRQACPANRQSPHLAVLSEGSFFEATLRRGAACLHRRFSLTFPGVAPTRRCPVPPGDDILARMNSRPRRPRPRHVTAHSSGTIRASFLRVPASDRPDRKVLTRESLRESVPTERRVTPGRELLLPDAAAR